VPPLCSSFVSLFIGMQSTWLLALAPEPNPRSDGALGGNKRNDRVAAARPVLVRSSACLVSSRLARLSPSFRVRDVSIFIKRARATAEKHSSLSRVRESQTTCRNERCFDRRKLAPTLRLSRADSRQPIREDRAGPLLFLAPSFFQVPKL
jgi:hypothetical protein